MKKIFLGILRGFAVFLIYSAISLVVSFPTVILPFIIRFKYDRYYTSYGNMNLSHFPWLYRIQFEHNFYLYQSWVSLILGLTLTPFLTYKLLKRFNFLGLSQKIVKLEIILLIILQVVQIVF